MTMEMMKRPSDDLPAHLQSGELSKGMNESLNQYVTPPRVKVVQPLTKPPVSEHFAAGDVCLMPMMQLVSKKQTEFSFVPLFFFAEFITTNPLGSDTFIRDRSTDPKSVIAQKARDPQRREETIEGGIKIRHTEVLNYIVSIVGHDELTGTPVTLSFARAEHKQGTNLASRIKLRNVPMCGTVWTAKSAQRSNPKGTWWGIDVFQCQEENGLVQDPAIFDMFVNQHNELKKAYIEQRLIVEQDEDNVDGSIVEGSVGAKTGEY